MTKRLRLALWVAVAFLSLSLTVPSTAQAQYSIPAIGSGATCWWGKVWPTGAPKFPDNVAKMGCVSTDPTASADCWWQFQHDTGGLSSWVVGGMSCSPYSGSTYCGTGGVAPLDFICSANSGSGYPCATVSPSIVAPTDENCTTACGTGFVDQFGNCTTPPKKKKKKEPHSSDCETCMAGGDNSPELPTSGMVLSGPGGSTTAPSGMSVADIYAMQVSGAVVDIPVGYQPPKGPGVFIRMFYNQKDTGQLAGTETAFHYGNIGPQWTLNTTSFVVDDPATPGATLTRYVAGGGVIDYTISGLTYTAGTGAFASERASKATLYRIPATGAVTSYELRFPSGTKHVYGLLDGNTVKPRRVFLTQIVDPQGNALSFSYDGTFRLAMLTDATGRTTTYSYTNTDPLKVTRITDPFGRHADMTYNGSGQLTSITDVVGIASSFGYSTAYGGYLNSLTTPYGTTTFNYFETADSYVPGTLSYQSMEQTDPLGQTKRVVFRDQSSLAVTPSPKPTGVTVAGDYSQNNSFIWDEHQYPLAITKDGSGNVTSEDTSKAQMTHWLKGGSGALAAVPGAVKQPLENAVFLNYQGQPNGATVGTYTLPTAVGRVLDNASSQVNKATYNALGRPLTTTDPTGYRIAYYTYAANNIDLLNIWQNGIYVATYSNYNSQHLPQTYKDAAGQFWNYAYNAAGQTIYVTNPLGQTRFWEYDSYGRVTRVTVPTVVAFASVVYGTTNISVPTASSYTYDSYDRVRTATDAGGYVKTYDYDALNRVTRITYPDATHDDRDYTFQSGPNIGQPSLDLRKATDRLGRITTYTFDANRRLTSVTEPLTASTTRTTSYSYYENGALKDQTDANGNVTHYAIDLQGRTVSKTYAYGTAAAKTETTAYENTTSRPKTFTDAQSQVKTITYGIDDLPTGIAYTATGNPTPNVSFVWDFYWVRPTSMTDGTGTTNFTYVAGLTNGALQLASVDNASFSNDTIANTYDALGRLSTRTIAGGNEGFTFDTLGRLATHTTPLGTFTYGYLGNTGQTTSRSVTVGSITTSSAWGYDTNANDRRLTSITNSGVTRNYGLSYLIAGGGGTSSPYDIQSITDTAAATHAWVTQSHQFTYDYADRLLTANQTTPGNNSYALDKLDNLTTATIPGSGTVNPTYNASNQLVTWGANTYTRDANGNTLSGDGTKTYKWDAENRLIEIDYVGGSNKTVFTYDGQNHRIATAETVGGVTTTTRNLWCGSRICQTRTSADAVLARYHPEGEYIVTGTKKYVYMPDQLGSVRDVIDATTGTAVAAIDYGPYGKPLRTWGTVTPLYQYAGLAYHPSTGLNLATYRALDSATGRWLNRDPIREAGGINLYGYAEANLLNVYDPSGLWSLNFDWVVGPGFGASVGVDDRTGSPFISVRFEWGLKIGADFKPFGNRPGDNKDSCDDPRNDGGSSISGFAGADIGIGHISGGASASAGAEVVVDPNKRTRSWFYGNSPELEGSLVRDIGLGGGAAAGFEIGLFKGPSPNCGCKK